MKKVLLIVLAVVALLVAGAAVFVATFKPAQRAAEDVTIERTAERVARGKYLAHHVSSCVDCHTRRDFATSPPKATGPEFAGGDCWGEREGFPGKLCPSNITPHGLGQWTDGQILRAIREGVNHEGKGLFPSMPYTEYASLSDEDAHAIVAYLRTVRAVDHDPGKTEIAFPVSFFVKMAPKPLAGPVPSANHADPIAYGAYLAKVGGCQFCHTPVDDRHQPLTGKDFSGGQEFTGPFGKVQSVNLTPHESGLGAWTKEQFVQRFKQYEGKEPAAIEPSKNSPMPWGPLSGLTADDLGAIYTFLRTVPPIANKVVARP